MQTGQMPAATREPIVESRASGRSSRTSAAGSLSAAFSTLRQRVYSPFRSGMRCRGESRSVAARPASVIRTTRLQRLVSVRALSCESASPAVRVSSSPAAGCAETTSPPGRVVTLLVSICPVSDSFRVSLPMPIQTPSGGRSFPACGKCYTTAGQLQDHVALLAHLRVHLVPPTWAAGARDTGAVDELLIEGAAVLPAAGADWLESAAVLVREGRVAELGPADELRRSHPDAERAGGADRLVMPGLVNAHQHAEGVSTAQLGFPDEPFEPWMVLMHSLPTVEPYLTTLYKSMLMLTSGVTTHVHSHFPAKGGYEGAEAYLDELEHSLRAHREAGLRTAFAPYWRDRATFTYDDDDRFAAALPGDLAGEVRRLTGTPISNGIYIEAITELARRLDA